MHATTIGALARLLSRILPEFIIENDNQPCCCCGAGLLAIGSTEISGGWSVLGVSSGGVLGGKDGSSLEAASGSDLARCW
jgi:hypothetical protein